MLDLSAIDGVLIEEANRLDEEILQNKLYVSPWVELVDVDFFPEGMGNAISQATYQPTRYSTLSWQKVGGSDGSGITVLPDVSTVESAKDMSEYQLYHVALESEKLNLPDLRTAAAAEAQLAAISDNLSFNTHRLLEERARSEYGRVCQIQVVADDPTSPSEGTISGGLATMPTTAATLELTNAFLGKYRQRILRMGAGNRPLDKVDNAPVFGLICDSEISDALKTELGENLRFAGRSNELLAPFGCDGVYKNFFHIIDDLMPRYTYAPSTYTEVAPETDASAGQGTKRIVNTAYEEAAYTDVIIFHQEVMKIKVPNTKVGRQGSGVSFEAKNYRGEWAWLNIKNVDADSTAYNPDGSIGFFRGVVAQATNIRKNLFGVRIRVLRPGFAS